MAKVIRDRGGWARSMPGGPQAAGLPDLFFFYRGYGGGLEVKTPATKSNVTPLQQATLEGIRKGGGIGLVVWEVSQIENLLDRIDRTKNSRTKR